ncbi:transporter [Actinorhabdospora filicis]|uniref:Transporter n=1 Tax=Actinorhabdospora filicis TaxID=1785913 RepID=A0A9W6SKV9_9ACTN|nr:DUF2975 domain-containing protein [Actinorhabdospora filicis]GLZ77863.1 transporter [Actinorhabdospora filicis]
MGKLAVQALRVVLVLLFGGSLFVQTVMLPLIAVNDSDTRPQAAGMTWALTVILILWIITAQVILVCVWNLLTMVGRGTVFSPGAFRWVHLIIGALIAAAVLTASLAGMIAPGDDVPPGMVLLLGGAVIGQLGVALIVLVLRMLLVQAAGMRAELDEVI